MICRSNAKPEGFITWEEIRDIGVRDNNENLKGVATTLEEEINSNEPGTILANIGSNTEHIEWFACPNQTCNKPTPKGSLICTACRCCYVYCDKEGKGFSPACMGICAMAIQDIEEERKARTGTEGARQACIRKYIDMRISQILRQRKVSGCLDMLSLSQR